MKCLPLFLLTVICCFLTGAVSAQPFYYLPQNNVWAFPNRKGLDFNAGGTPQGLVSQMIYNEPAATVCDERGRMLFYTDGNRIWNRNHQLMPNGNNLINSGAYTDGQGTSSTAQGAAIVPVLGSEHRYYVFSLEDRQNSRGGLFYTVVDMSLANGMGDVVPGQRAILLDRDLTEKMVPVAGDNCNVWLMVRDRGFTGYKAYEITRSGISSTPVISPVGVMLPADSYLIGVIRFSPDRRRMVAGGRYAQMELYDFDPATGMLSNATPIGTAFGANTKFHGASFSPDNTRLYVNGWIGDLRQYDLTQATPAAIEASEVQLLGNLMAVGDVKLGPDGKIYANSFKNDRDSLHVIHNPNGLGLACGLDTFAIPTPVSGGAKVGLPNDLAFPVPDTVRSLRSVCLWNRDSILLEPAAASGRGYRWQDGVQDAYYTTSDTGMYTVLYSENQTGPCIWYADTFRVIRPEVPVFEVTGSCPGQGQGQIMLFVPPGEPARFAYALTDISGRPAGNISGQPGGRDTFAGLDPGIYMLRISLASAGCDSVIEVEIPAFQAPRASFRVSDHELCAGDSVFFRNTSPDPFTRWQWKFGDGTEAARFSAAHAYGRPGTYEAVLIMYTDHCADSFSEQIVVKDFRLTLSADKQIYDPGEPVRLTTSGSDQYTVDAWFPEYLFDEPHAYAQQLYADSSRKFTVAGRSFTGCPDTAEVSMILNALLYMPSAFSPNGDGVNDYFRPIVSGENLRIHYIQVFNRWGEAVWRGYGSAGMQGWDGRMTDGSPAEIGAYFWIMEFEIRNEGAVMQKGDLVLVR